MAKCPVCSERVSLFYQVLPINHPDVMYRNFLSLRHNAVIACDHCRGRLKVKDPFNPDIVLKVLASFAVGVMLFMQIQDYLGIHDKYSWLLFIALPFCAAMFLVIRFFWRNFTHLEISDEH
jgi:hypothetical protein